MMIARLLRITGTCLGLAILSLSVGCATIGVTRSKALPEEMLGTWLFENSFGDNEQMAIFANGRVVVLYSNGHKDETLYIDGALEKLTEYNASRVKTSIADDGALVQRFRSSSFAKIWKRIDEKPRTTLLRPLS